MIETGRLNVVNPPREVAIAPERFVTLAGRITIQAPRASQASYRPFDGRFLADLPICESEDVTHAAKMARAAQQSWADTTPKERAKVLLCFHDLLLKHQDEVLDIVQLETGKARRHAFDELIDSAMNAQFNATRGVVWLRPRRAGGTFVGLTQTWEYRHPVGLVGVIAPWNYPLTMAVTEPVAALMAGNGVILKPDPQTSFAALWIHELFEKAGLPKGLFQVVTGAGEIGSALINNVDNVAFTGSTATGRKVARQASERLLGVSLELGGKNPMLVLEDANLEAAVAGAIRGCFTNSGQLCVAIERIYVHEKIYDAFVGRLVEATAGLRLGTTLDHRAQVGSLTVKRQFDIVVDHVQDAVAKGAKVLVGGKARPDLGALFFEPTLLTYVTPAMKIHAQETFGPVVSIYKFNDLEQAIRQANDSEYGLNASVWTQNLNRGRAVAARIQAGTVNVNEAFAAAWASMDATMGGVQSLGDWAQTR